MSHNQTLLLLWKSTTLIQNIILLLFHFQTLNELFRGIHFETKLF